MKKKIPFSKKIDKLIDSIKNRIIDFDNLFIVISGDIAFSGKSTEYEIAKKYFGKIKRELEDYSQKKIDLIGVPGNHDCDFENEQKARELIIDGLKNQNYSDLDLELIKQCCKPQEEYFKFQDAYLNKNCKVILKNELLNIIEFQFGDFNLVFNCFNTSWTSKKREQEGAIDFPIHFFSQEEFDNLASLKINIIHHPINWQSKSSHRELRKFLNHNGNITLSGHEHQSEINKMIDSYGNKNIYIESGALQETKNTKNSYYNLISINLKANKIKADSFSYNSGKYVKNEILEEQELLDYKKRSNIEQPLNITFSNYLDSLSAQFLHKRIDKLLIDDLFVSPYLRITDQKTDKIKIINLNKVLNVNKLNKAIIIGDESSGKTTLCKKIFKEYHNKGFLPVFIKGSKIAKPNFDYILNNLIKEAFVDQYHKKAVEKFDEIDKNKVVLIIDDLNACKLKDEYRISFVKTVNEYFKYIFFSSDSLLYFNPIADGEGEFDDYQIFNIVEFSYELRYKLIQKWNSLGENELSGNELARKNENYDQIIKNFLGKNFLPSFPSLIITSLQSIDHGNSSEQGFSYYYKYLIEESLKKNIKKADNLQFYNFFLADICFFLFKEKIKTLSKASFEDYFAEYLNRKKVAIAFNEAFSQLIDSKIIRIGNDFVSISYPYIYYYYVAVYIANNIEKPIIKELVDKMIERLYIDEYANVFIFLTQISSNPYIIETLKNHTDEYFKDHLPACLSNDYGIDDLIKRIPELVLVDDKTIEERRQYEIRKREEAEIRDMDVDKQYLSKDFDINEDISSISLLNRFIRAIKTFEIFGQVIKKNWGQYDGKLKEKYVKSTFDLSMKVLSAYLTYIKKNEKELLDHIYYVADKREVRDKQEIKKLAKNLIFHLAYVTSHGIIKRVSKSIGHNQLKKTFNDIVLKHPSNSFKLIKLSISLDHYGNLPNDEIRFLLNKDKEFKKYYLPKVLLQNFVYQYLHMYEMPYDERNRICSLVGIKIERLRQIQGGSKEMK